MPQNIINLIRVIYFTAIAINLGLSMFVFFKDRKSPVNRSFGLLIFFITLWIISLYFFFNENSPEAWLFARRLTSFSTSFIVAFFLYFSIVFPRAERPLSFFKRALIFLPAMLLACLSLFTPYIIAGMEIGENNLRTPLLGIAYPFATIYYLSFVLLSLINLLYKFFQSKDREKLQLFYILAGVGITGLGGIITGLILPLAGLPQFVYLGPPLAIFMAAMLSYAIVNYRLLDIEDFLSRGIFYLAVAIALIGTFVILQTGKFGFLPSFYFSLFNLALSLLVYFQNKKSAANISFSAILFIAAAWTFSIGIFLQSTEVCQLFFWSRIFYLLAALIPSTLLYFSIVFPVESPQLNNFQKFCIFIPSFIFIPIVLFFDLIVKEFYFSAYGIEAAVGPLYPYYSLYYCIFLGYAFFNLLLKYKHAGAVDQIRICYVFWALALVGGVATLFNIILPWLGNYQLIWVGTYSTVFLSGLISYAIVVHRLMRVEVMVQRAFIYTLATGIIMALYAVAVIMSERYFRDLFQYSSVFLTALGALILAIIYHPLIRFLQHFTDRLFFKGQYDYQKTLKQVGQSITTILKIEDITRLIVDTFVKTLRISEISFLTYDERRGRFCPVIIDQPEGRSSYKRIEIDETSPIIYWLRVNKDILVLDEIEDEVSRLSGRTEEEAYRRFLEKVATEMKNLGVAVWVPLVYKKELIGIVSLGAKLSGDIFSSEDFGLLNTLANQTALALENARLYTEVVETKNYAEGILNAVVAGVFTTDILGNLTTFNPMAEKITGYQAAEVVGKNCNEVFSPHGALVRTIKSALSGKTVYNREEAFVSKKRGRVPVSLSTNLLYDRHQRKIGVVLSITDLSEVKELESKIRRADKLGALATMAAGMAHEIKNPLSSMKVLTQLLPLKFGDEEFRAKFIDIMPKEINRIDRIVESLLGFARATALKFELGDVKALLEEQIKYYERQATEASVKVHKKFAALPQIMMDHNQLTQVFSNLILNAIHAMPQGGELTIETREGKKLENELQDIVVVISDTGHGMNPEQLKKLFDPFFTTKHGGTGLGLTISHNIVDGHHGYIDVSSELGKGTSFTITLPVKQKLV